MKRIIIFEFTRKIDFFIKNGFVTEQGRFIDADFNEKEACKELKKVFRRTVDDVDDKFVYLREIRNLHEPVYKRMFRNEGKGELLDQSFPDYPFNAGDDIQIELLFLDKEEVNIKIQLIN